MKTSNTLLGILGAAAVGAVVGVLFAPEKGSKTRKKIADKSKGCSEDLKEKLNEFVGSLSENGKEMLASGKAKYNELKSDVRQDISDARSDIKNATN
ncbi:YtxH domain-containing protein [Flavobacterium sp. TMP13]|uniref:YtxH domain-containing protein n=1 Tax=Flavobacterium sp. TMP13 TaxID=3425950 RepID=UPI003D778D28